jgi:hypothetical protein
MDSGHMAPVALAGKVWSSGGQGQTVVNIKVDMLFSLLVYRLDICQREINVCLAFNAIFYLESPCSLSC